MTRFAIMALAVVLGAAWLLNSGNGRTDEPRTTVTVQPGAAQAGGDKMAGPTKATCVLVPLSGSKVHGVIHFTQMGDSVQVSGEVAGLKPGLHGFHIHQFGDLTDPKGMSTGGHFNPEGMKHGGPHTDKRHVGDLGNIKADESGIAKINLTDKLISLHGKHSIVGRAVIVHEKEDDLKTDPTGEAGGRIGGGVIGIGKTEEKK